jgi:uncharacterized membrane protein
MVENTFEAAGLRVADPSLVTYTHVIYALHALGVFIGLSSAMFVVTAFIFSLPSIIAVIMNYARQKDVRGTYLESHFRWQIRTFWFALLGAVLIWAISIPLMVVLIGFVTWWLMFLVLGAWIIYRVVRGWVRLKNGMPAPID